jgi:hypothetical protein
MLFNTVYFHLVVRAVKGEAQLASPSLTSVGSFLYYNNTAIQKNTQTEQVAVSC